MTESEMAGKNTHQHSDIIKKTVYTTMQRFFLSVHATDLEEEV
jgi:hypothetical protein